MPTAEYVYSATHGNSWFPLSVPLLAQDVGVAQALADLGFEAGASGAAWHLYARSAGSSQHAYAIVLHLPIAAEVIVWCNAVPDVVSWLSVYGGLPRLRGSEVIPERDI